LPLAIALCAALSACSSDDSSKLENASVCSQDGDCQSGQCDGFCTQACSTAADCDADETCIALGDDPDARLCWPTCSGSDTSNCTSRNPDLTQCVEGVCSDEG
jgi:hypothetical protein